jgi:uncharacterized protein YndB with AHSA1/START domain
MPSSDAAGRTIVTQRALKCPRERVWRAFADAKALESWWGPDGFTSAFETFDFRPGGAWNMTMTGPDGTRYPNTMRFVEIVEPGRIVYEYLDPVHAFRMDIVLEERGMGTFLTWRMTFERQDEFDKVKDFVVPANEQNFDKLEDYLSV